MNDSTSALRRRKAEQARRSAEEAAVRAATAHQAAVRAHERALAQFERVIGGRVNEDGPGARGYPGSAASYRHRPA